MLDNKIFQKLTTHAKHSLKEANQIAQFYGCKKMKPEHLFLAIFLEQGSFGSNILKDMGVKKSFFEKVLIREKIGAVKKENLKEEIPLSGDSKEAIVRAYSLANEFKYPFVGTEHLVFSIMEKPVEAVQKILTLATKEREKRKSRASIKTAGNKKGNEVVVKTATIDKNILSGLFKAFNFPDIHLAGGAQSETDTPSLDYFCVNLNEQVKKNKTLIIGREKELDRIISSLGRKYKNNPLLIGEPGVGKTAVVEGLANKINAGQVPHYLFDKQILMLDMALVVAGTSFRGEFEQRIKDIIYEATNNENVILFIDETHNIVGAGNVSGGLDAANILKPALARGEIQCIGATTIDEYKKHIEKDSALDRRFQSIIIDEPTNSETEKIIAGIKKSYEKYHGVTIESEAIKQAVVLSSRYISDKLQPDKAIDLIDETSARLRSQQKGNEILLKIRGTEAELEKLMKTKHRLISEEKFDEAMELRKREEKILNKIVELKKRQKTLVAKNKLIINAEEIARTVATVTNIPFSKLVAQSSERVRKIEQRLQAKVIGQKEVIKKIANTILRSQSGIANPEQPLGSFLFLGPSGVGKTLTAKTLAQEFFGDKKSLIKIDMSEFGEKHTVSQLLGAPAGYVGYGEGGLLTEKVRRQPYSLILFDEIEKAHPDVFNILLQVLEEGILTDAEGRQVDFKNTIIILTSNIGTVEFTKASVGFGQQDKIKNKKEQSEFETIKGRVLEELKHKLKPEIINRIDHLTVFNRLSESDIKKIVRLELKYLGQRLRSKNIKLEFNQRSINFLAKNSLADKGARGVHKSVRELVENKIAEKILDDKMTCEKIKLDEKNNKIVI